MKRKVVISHPHCHNINMEASGSSYTCCYQNFFLLIVLSKVIDIYCIDTALSFILLFSEMQKIRRTKVEPHFLKKLAFLTNKCLAQDAFGKCPRTTGNLPKYKAVREQLCAQSYVYKAIPVSDLYRLPRWIAPYTQCLR